MKTLIPNCILDHVNIESDFVKVPNVAMCVQKLLTIASNRRNVVRTC